MTPTILMSELNFSAATAAFAGSATSSPLSSTVTFILVCLALNCSTAYLMTFSVSRPILDS